MNWKSCGRQPNKISCLSITLLCWLVLFWQNVKVSRLLWVSSLVVPLSLISDAGSHLYLIFSHPSNQNIALTTWTLPTGENASTCYGSVLQGQFEGTIHTTDGAYHVESMQRYTSSPTDHHSIIYREDDMGKTISLRILWREKKKHVLYLRTAYFPVCFGSVATHVWLPALTCCIHWPILENGRFVQKHKPKKVSCLNCSPATPRLMLQLEAFQRDGPINLSSALILEDLNLQPEVTIVHCGATQGQWTFLPFVWSKS